MSDHRPCFCWQRWEAHIKDRQPQARAADANGVESLPAHLPLETGTTSAFAALRAWSALTRRARDALRKSNPMRVDALEEEVLEFMAAGESVDELTVELKEGFQRLLLHGLAKYHGLQSHSRPSEEGNTRVVCIRQPPQVCRTAPGSRPCPDSAICQLFCLLIGARSTPECFMMPLACLRVLSANAQLGLGAGCVGRRASAVQRHHHLRRHLAGTGAAAAAGPHPSGFGRLHGCPHVATP